MTGGEWSDEAGQARRFGRLEQLVDGPPDDITADPAQEFARTSIHFGDAERLGVEHDDGFDDGVEDRLGQLSIVTLVIAGRLRRRAR